MKICFISEAKSLHTRRWLQGLAQAGLELNLISSSHDEIPGVKLHHLPIYSAKLWEQVKNIKKINHLIKEINPDIIHLFGLFSVNSLGSMFTVTGKKNLIISLWGSDTVAAGNRETIKSKFIKNYILTHCSRCVATSEYLATEAKRFVNNTIPIDVVPWGIDINNFYIDKAKRHSKSIKLGYAKKLEYIYGPDTLLKAFADTFEKVDTNIKLKIAGDGSLENRLKKMAKHLNIDNRIEWLGWLKNVEELRNFYNSIDIFVMPSRRESFGVSAAEASVMELPVIASNFGGIPEIVINGESGILVQPDDVDGFGNAMAELVNNEKKRRAMGKRGKQFVLQNYSWQESIKRMIEIYYKLAN